MKWLPSKETYKTYNNISDSPPWATPGERRVPVKGRFLCGDEKGSVVSRSPAVETFR